jgi:hypothetical protein
MNGPTLNYSGWRALIAIRDGADPASVGIAHHLPLLAALGYTTTAGVVTDEGRTFIGVAS